MPTTQRGAVLVHYLTCGRRPMSVRGSCRLGRPVPIRLRFGQQLPVSVVFQEVASELNHAAHWKTAGSPVNSLFWDKFNLIQIVGNHVNELGHVEDKCYSNSYLHWPKDTRKVLLVIREDTQSRQ